jgi:hypothetical protein
MKEKLTRKEISELTQEERLEAIKHQTESIAYHTKELEKLVTTPSKK